MQRARRPRWGNLGLIAFSDVVLLEEVLIIQRAAVLKPMLSLTNDEMLCVSNIWILMDCVRSPAIHAVSQHVIGGFFSIRDVNLQEVDASLIITCERLRSVIAWDTIVTIIIFFRVSHISGIAATYSTSSPTGAR